MDYRPSDTEAFISNFHFFNENLPLEEGARRAYISIGSNLFVKFGKEENIGTFRDGRPSTKSPWTIWLSDTSWRLSKDNIFIIGSNDPYEKMNENLKELLGKKFIASRIISQFMDLQIDFENGYQLTTFFNSMSRADWVLFPLNENTIGIGSETEAEIQQTIELSKHFEIIEPYQLTSLAIDGKAVVSFEADGYLLTINFESDQSLLLYRPMWRIEHNNSYCIGSLDNYSDRAAKIADQYLAQIIGKKLIRLSMVKPFTDAKFEFEDGWIIKTFSCWGRQEEQWCLSDMGTENNFANLTFSAESDVKNL